MCNMEKVFNKLERIKKVEASEALYRKILGKIKEQNQVSVLWVATAAAVFACLIITEVYVINNAAETNELANLEVVVPQTNNLLYNE
ncbi:MAG: hypothetical protein ACI9M9_000510 [Flavobacteriaceae bacterium]|jgi:hypothetical protein